MAEENLFDNTILVSDTGEVIEESGTGDNGSQTTPTTSDGLGEGEFLVNELGQVIDETGQVIPQGGPTPDEDDEGKASSERHISKSGTEGTSSTEGSNSTLYPPFAKALIEDGTLPQDLEIPENADADWWKATIREQIRKNEFADLDDDAKQLLEVMRSGGDVSAFLEAHAKGQKANKEFESITESNAEAFTREFYKQQGLSDKVIDELIDTRIINNTLVSEAEKSLPMYKENLEKSKKVALERSKAQQAEAEARVLEAQKAYKQVIDSTESFIEGQKLNESIKEQVYKLGTTPAGKDQNGNPITAIQQALSEDFNGVTAKLNYIYVVTNGFKNMENLSYSKSAQSKATQELNKLLEQERRSGGGISSPGKDSNSNKPNILDANF